MGDTYQTYGCPASTLGWSYVGGRILIDGEAPHRDWPVKVDSWASEVALSAMKHGVSAQWIAAIMALESGGVPDLCYRPGGPGSPCSTADGAGLMAMLQFVASNLAGRMVSLQELMADPQLAIDLGAKLLAILSSENAGDYMRVALAYNAGAVHCASVASSGTTVQTPKESCPPTPWGVRMGCVRTKHASAGPYCAPSTINPALYVCPNDYPRRAAGLFNAAHDAGWTDAGLSAVPPPPAPPGTTTTTKPTSVASVGGSGVGWAAIGAVCAALATRYALSA